MRKDLKNEFESLKKVVKWNFEDVMTMCIRHGYYTCGNNAQYEDMLEYVMTHKNPTDYDIFLVATDIFDHSTGDVTENVTDIMFNLYREVVTTFFYNWEDRMSNF